MELGFLVDGSESINTPNKTNFKNSLEFVKSIVQTFRISKSEVRVGMAVFSTDVNTIFKFDKYSDKANVVKVNIYSLQYFALHFHLQCICQEICYWKNFLKYITISFAVFHFLSSNLRYFSLFKLANS